MVYDIFGEYMVRGS